MRPELSNARMTGEPFPAYQARRRAVNEAVRTHLAGRMAHVSSSPVVLPLPGVDSQADAQVLAGRYRDAKLVTLPGGKQIRVARTKGISYVRSGLRAFQLRRQAAGRRI